MKRLGLLVTVVVVGLITYVAIFSATVRYRLTLEAEVDGKPKNGSGVIEVTYSKNNDPISSSQFSISVRGEAIAFHLGSQGTLFALLKGAPTVARDPIISCSALSIFPAARFRRRLPMV